MPREDDSRYEEAALSLWDAERVFIYRGRIAQEMNGFFKKLGCGPVGFDDTHLSYGFVKTLSDGLSMVPCRGLVEKLRMVKDEEEIRLIEASVRLNHGMLEWLPERLQPGRNEAEISWDIEKYYREHGASELSFPSIVAVDANAALPHYSPQDRPAPLAENCQVLIDEGCRFGLYCSDQTRTFWIGDRPAPWFAEMLSRVQEAQRRAIAFLRPGITGSQAHEVAARYFTECGVSRYFTHSLGHGVGLDTHEGPRLGPFSEDVLQPGMIVTIEPGLYYPGRGGARWEHMAVITGDGCRVL